MIEIKIKDGTVQGVVLVIGEEIRARAVISNADPKRTFLKLMDPVLLSPTFTKRLQNYRMNGTVAKVNLALAGLPSFAGSTETPRRSPEEFRSDPRSIISSAHSTNRNMETSRARRISKLRFRL